MEGKQWVIKYTTTKHHKKMKFYGTYYEAMLYYTKIKWSKALWDITKLPELIHCDDQNGHGGPLTSTFELVNKS